MARDGEQGSGAKRPRASQAAGPLRASMVALPRPPLQDEAAAPTVPEPAAATAPARQTSRPAGTTKYTVNLHHATAEAFDNLALMARRKLGRKVEKNEILETLLLLAADDASLRDQVFGQLPTESPRKQGRGDAG